MAQRNSEYDRVPGDLSASRPRWCFDVLIAARGGTALDHVGRVSCQPKPAVNA